MGFAGGGGTWKEVELEGSALDSEQVVLGSLPLSSFVAPPRPAVSPPLSCRAPLHPSSGVCGNQTAGAVQPGSRPPRPQGTGRGRREPQRLKPAWPPAQEGGFWRELGCLPDEGVSSLLGIILWDPRASSKESLAPVFSPYTGD